MRKRPRDREKNSLLCVPCILDAARRLLGCGLPDGLHGGCRRARRDEVLSETLARRGLTPGKRVIVYDTGGKDAPLDEHGARGVEFVLVGRDRPCGDPAAGLQGGAFVPREEPGTGGRIRSARCGAHVHTVQRMRNASCEYGHGSFSFRRSSDIVETKDDLKFDIKRTSQTVKPLVQTDFITTPRVTSQAGASPGTPGRNSESHSPACFPASREAASRGGMSCKSKIPALVYNSRKLQAASPK